MTLNARSLVKDPKKTVVIENVAPTVDGGRYPVKREVGDVLDVTADIFREGHERLLAFLKVRPPGAPAWSETPMRYVDNDRWAGRLELSAIGRWTFTIEALTDLFRSWLADLDKRVNAGQDVGSEILEGAALVQGTAKRANGEDRRRLESYAQRIGGRREARTPAAKSRASGAAADAEAPKAATTNAAAASARAAADTAAAVAAAREPELAALMDAHVDRTEATWAEREFEVVVDRERARFAAWYEFFPRSGQVPGRHATFEDAGFQLRRAAAMGFDVVYLPPIHPVGTTNRKGRNNALVAAPGDPGSVWAIGSAAGGHTTVNPDLGTLEDFDRFLGAARELGLEVALDFAIQCSPDHPWVREHPEWFFHRPDGTIKYAENPPKKYQDVYPLNFYCPDPEPLWQEMRRVLEFWIARGVRTFRVDNPHTKPVKFWEWLIRGIQDAHPDVIFLAEAFTRPKVMKVLAKAGFTQSYTYFAWRHAKPEMIEYFTEITTPPVSDYFRGHLWPNTPDILTASLVQGGRAAFKTRLVLAATLSSLYGIYSGYELSEATPLGDGSEEYRDSEKYELKIRDWDAPGNLGALITRVNRARREHPALQLMTNLRFYGSDNPHVLWYGKASPDGRDVVFVAVSLDVSRTQESQVDVPLEALGLDAARPYEMREILGDTSWTWQGPRGYVKLDPAADPAQIFVPGRRPA